MAVEQDIQLDSILAMIWRITVAGLGNTDSPFHSPVLATINEAGIPQARCVILQSVDRRVWSIGFNTDLRSEKVRSIHKLPETTLVVFDPSHNTQVRFTGKAHLHLNDAIANTAWEKTDPGARMLYRSPNPPGSPISDPKIIDRTIEDSERSVIDAGRRNFASIIVNIQSIEWIGFNNNGQNRRAIFTRAPDKTSIISKWLSP